MTDTTESTAAETVSAETVSTEILSFQTEARQLLQLMGIHSLYSNREISCVN